MPVSSIITPTIGRKVWYHTKGALVLPDGTAFCPVCYGVQPLDATVIYVWGDRMVNLDITDHEGNRFIAKSVTLVQPGGEAPNSCGYCVWTPYQQAQAARPVLTEADAAADLAGTPRPDHPTV